MSAGTETQEGFYSLTLKDTGTDNMATQSRPLAAALVVYVTSCLV